jgi:hypothetical protein
MRVTSRIVRNVLLIWQGPALQCTPNRVAHRNGDGRTEVVGYGIVLVHVAVLPAQSARAFTRWVKKIKSPTRKKYRTVP